MPGWARLAARPLDSVIRGSSIVKLRSAPASATARAAPVNRRSSAAAPDTVRYERMAQVSIVTSQAAGVIRDDDAMRFTFVGDSMTIGCAGDFTWRYRMWQHLTSTLGAPF